MVDGDSRGETPDQSTSPDHESFIAELTRLKCQGCCVLVTGAVSERVRTAQSRQLFGVPGAPRQRILTLTDATAADAAQYLPGEITPNHSRVTVLDYPDEVRGECAVADLSAPHPSPATQPGTDKPPTMTNLGATLHAAITAKIQPEHVHAGELRVGIATLNELLSTDGLSATCAFISAVQTDVLAAHGMSHIHLSGETDDTTLAALRSIVDIHLELREDRRDAPEHRWHLFDANLISDWYSI